LAAKRHTVVNYYPAQVNPPRGPQLLLVELVDSEDAVPKAATLESLFSVFGLSHFGQAGVRSASEKRRIISKASPHSLQRYSYKGIDRFPYLINIRLIRYKISSGYSIRYNTHHGRKLMIAFIEPPQKNSLLLRIGIWVSEKITGRIMLPARILAWYPKAALGSGLLESLVTHHDGKLDERMLKLVRMAASFAAACPFCIDMNSHGHESMGISADEMLALRAQVEIESVSTFSARERLAIQYSRLVSQTPLKFHPDFIEQVKANFNEREIVILASTAAQVNYWARLIQALGIPAAGFSE
jgi:alkylhydroperoxidase family enzyme